MVCGASSAFGSRTVTIPLRNPAGSAAVFNDSCSGIQVAASRVAVQPRDGPAAAVIQLTEDDSVSDNEPSPLLYASTVRVPADVFRATATGPTVELTRRSTGAPYNELAEKIARENRKRGSLRPTRGHPSYTPRCNPRPGSRGTLQSSQTPNQPSVPVADCPGEQENRFHVEDHEKDRDDVEAHRVAAARIRCRLDAALVGLQLGRRTGPTGESAWRPGSSPPGKAIATTRKIRIGMYPLGMATI